LDGSVDDLARRAGTGDADAFADLVASHYDRIYRMAWRWAGNATDAEDIAQDVCVKLATAIRQYRGEAAFTTWLYRLTFTTATDRLRARQRIRLVDPSDVMELVDHADTTTPESDLIGAELWVAVRALPAQQRDAVLLVYGEDLNHGEAARVMGCSEKTVSWHLHEAKKRLRVKLEAVG
jgi:RNA polymerase sigma-70 factor (ECF subfamily)